MVSALTFIYAALALLGGALGAYFAKARLSAGVYMAGIGFLASVFAQRAGFGGLIDFAAFVVAGVAIGLAFKLRPLQIAIILAVVVAANFLGGFLIGFGEGIAHPRHP